MASEQAGRSADRRRRHQRCRHRPRCRRPRPQRPAGRAERPRERTSSASTKLIHGGLRYLEYYEFRLVREALIEREVLLRDAPHIIRPLTFVLPHSPELRPAWLVRLGLLLYDHLGGRKLLPGSRGSTSGAIRSARRSSHRDQGLHLFRLPGRRCAAGGVERPRREGARRRDPDPHPLHRRRAREGALAGRHRDVATGERPRGPRPLPRQCRRPLGRELRGAARPAQRQRVRLVKGATSSSPGCIEGDQPYILQNNDRRIVFAIPYEGDFIPDRHHRRDL